jgi:acyl dehydratase
MQSIQDQYSSARGRFLEDWTLGERLVTQARRLEARDIAAFVKLCGDDNPLHLGEQPLVPGLYAASVATGLVAGLGVFAGSTVALLHQACDFLRPLRAPCSVRVEMEVVGVEPWKDETAGVVTTRRDIIDEKGTIVARCTHRTLVRRRAINENEKEHRS